LGWTGFNGLPVAGLSWPECGDAADDLSDGRDGRAVHSTRDDSAQRAPQPQILQDEAFAPLEPAACRQRLGLEYLLIMDGESAVRTLPFRPPLRGRRDPFALRLSDGVRALSVPSSIRLGRNGGRGGCPLSRAISSRNRPISSNKSTTNALFTRAKAMNPPRAPKHEPNRRAVLLRNIRYYDWVLELTRVER